MNLPFGEARDRLQSRIKQDSVELKQMEKELLEAKRIVDTYQQNIKEIDNDMKGNGNAGNEKYEILF